MLRILPAPDERDPFNERPFRPVTVCAFRADGYATIDAGGELILLSLRQAFALAERLPGECDDLRGWITPWRAIPDSTPDPMEDLLMSAEQHPTTWRPTQSEQLAELAAALSAVQGAVLAAAKDGENPHFKSEFATLSSVWDVIRSPLSANGLAVIQAPQRDEIGPYLETTLVHKSGQWMKSYHPLSPVAPGPQAMGSAITYARRYALCAMVGVVGRSEDDDAEGAMARPKPAPKGAAPARSAEKPASPEEIATRCVDLRKRVEEAKDAEALGEIRKEIEKEPPATKDALRPVYLSVRKRLVETARRAPKEQPGEVTV